MLSFEEVERQEQYLAKVIKRLEDEKRADAKLVQDLCAFVMRPETQLRTGDMSSNWEEMW